MPAAHRHMSYKNFNKNHVTKPIPIKRVFNPEYFDMHLATKHLKVPKLWFNGSNGLANF